MATTRGNTLVAALLVIMVLAGLALGFMETGVQTSGENVMAGDRTKVFYIAEAGVNAAIADIYGGGDGDIGTKGAPIRFGGGHYWAITKDHGDGSYTILSNAFLNGQRKAIEVVLAPETIPIFTKALFGDLDLGAEGAVFTDSYDSELGDYASQAVNYDEKTGKTFAKDGGSLGSNQDIILRGGVTVLGDATPGPGHMVTISGTNVYISGSTAPAPKATPFPPIIYEPPVASKGDFKPNADGTAVFSGGSYHFDNFVLSSETKVLFNGDVTLYVDNNFDLSGKAQLVVNPEASVTIFHTGDSFSLTGQGLVNTSERPSSFRLFTEAKTVKYAGTSAFYGGVYAPNGTITPVGTTDIYGSFVARQIDIGGTANFHYDEALTRTLGKTKRLKRVSWRWVAPVNS